MIYGFMVYEKAVEHCFEYAQNYGIGHLEIDLKKKHSHLHTFTPERIATIRHLAETTGISLSLHPPFNINPSSPFPWVRRYYLLYLKKVIRLAQQLKVSHITLHIGSFFRTAIWSNPREQTLEKLCKTLRRLLPLCEPFGISLALENVIPIPPESGFSYLGDSIADFHYIFSHLESDCLSFCLDTGHANTNAGPLAYVEALGPKITCVHFHDNHGTRDEHQDIGNGTVPWKELLAALNKINFHGPYVSECFRSSPHDAISQLKAFL